MGGRYITSLYGSTLAAEHALGAVTDHHAFFEQDSVMRDKNQDNGTTIPRRGDSWKTAQLGEKL
jgi:hypothetical protein